MTIQIKKLSGNGGFLYCAMRSVIMRRQEFFTKGKGVNDMRKHGNGLEVGRAGTMEVKATKGAESTKAPKKQTGGDLRSNKR